MRRIKVLSTFLMMPVKLGRGTGEYFRMRSVKLGQISVSAKRQVWLCKHRETKPYLFLCAFASTERRKVSQARENKYGSVFLGKT
jgi:hypothetical protein